MNAPKISKEKFIKIFNELKESDRLCSEVNAIFRNSFLNTDFLNGASMSIYHTGLVLDLLDIVMGSNDLCSWWYYENEMGKRGFVVSYLNNDETWIDTILPDVSSLYDFIVKTYDEKNDNGVAAQLLDM